MKISTVICLCVFSVCLPGVVYSRGFLKDPPGRASRWLTDPSAPTDYNHNSRNCGGMDVQAQNGGKCGWCGDAWNDEVRQHEYGGMWGEGIIVKRIQAGTPFPVTAELTAGYDGYFEYFIWCGQETKADIYSDPMDNNDLKPVKFENGDTKYPVGKVVGEYVTNIVIDKVCNHALLIWQYTTGNHWGVCENGTQGIGCGPQEIFRGCSDIELYQPVPQ